LPQKFRELYEKPVWKLSTIQSSVVTIHEQWYKNHYPERFYTKKLVNKRIDGCRMEYPEGVQRRFTDLKEIFKYVENWKEEGAAELRKRHNLTPENSTLKFV